MKKTAGLETLAWLEEIVQLAFLSGLLYVSLPGWVELSHVVSELENSLQVVQTLIFYYLIAVLSGVVFLWFFLARYVSMSNLFLLCLFLLPICGLAAGFNETPTIAMLSGYVVARLLLWIGRRYLVNKLFVQSAKVEQNRV